jgi:uncharacterized membrane protein
MQQSTKTALGIAAGAYAVNRYQNYKLRTSEKGYLEQPDQNLKMTSGGVAILALASAGILEYTKDKPKARKIAFVGLAAGTVGYFLIILAALRKMS